MIRSIRWLAAPACALAMFAAEVKTQVPPEVRPALEHISANSMRGNLSFLASDLLEGRATPSRGLDVAAEYIAAQFRRAGLEPAGDDGYFQTASFLSVEPNPEGFSLEITGAPKPLATSWDQISLESAAALSLDGAPAVKIDPEDAAALGRMKPGELEGKVALVALPDMQGDNARRMRVFRALGQLERLKPALVVAAGPMASRLTGRTRLIDPENRRPPGTPTLALLDPAAVEVIAALPAGETRLKVTLRAKAAIEKPVKLHNVVGLLRGVDPALKDSYVLLTAHYDHIGMRARGEGDRIFNGANDDGSGTVSVIEIATALAALPQRPRRSIVFMTFFGEELGLVGSRYYGRHPVFPLVKTVADVNLEQVGRTDSSDGPEVANASFTGFDYSDVPTVFEAAGKLTGVRVYKDGKRSDPFFSRSDNQLLADLGVPAHTLCVAYEYPDYHGAGDEWEKINYDNMAKVDRMVALGLWLVATDANAPKWNEANPKAAKYVEAAKRLKERGTTVGGDRP